MAGLDPFTIVVPTRDNPVNCRHMMDVLVRENAQLGLPIHIVFLLNNSGVDGNKELQNTISDKCFASLEPRILRAARNFSTMEENIFHTLGDNLDAVDEHFVIIGDSDQVNLTSLPGALEFLRVHQIDLLLVGAINREMYEGKPIRQIYFVPRHLNPKNRLGAGSCHGKDIYSDAFADYGPDGFISYPGCQIYTKRFFKQLCGVVAEFPEPLYTTAVATLELTMRQECAVGFWPEVVVTRIDHLLYGPDTDQQPPNWWIPQSRMNRGLSQHVILSIISNSLRLSPAAFSILVNCQMVSNRRAAPQYIFTNFLFSFVEQIRNVYKNCPDDRTWHYSAQELRDIVTFGERLGSVDIGLPAEHRALISQWLQHFEVIGDYSNPSDVRELMSGANMVLELLDRRPGMDRWVAQLLLA